MRLIDADAFKKQLEESYEYTELSEVIEMLDNAPTIIWCSETSDGLPLMDLRPRPQGEWIKNGAYYDERAKSMFDKCSCSICGRTQSFYEDDETGELYSFNFCPNCGARMKGSTE